MNSKLVSVAMATYNGEKFLREQLDSIYSQTYKNIEVVVCDDCSTDKTVEILVEYNQKYGLKFFINDKKLGYSKNFEKAASLCNGDYIAFSDQDDIWSPEKIETLVNEIGKFSLVHSDAKVTDINGHITSDSIKKSSKLINFMGTCFKKVSYVSFVQGCTILVKKEVFYKALPVPCNEPHDWWLAMVASKLDGIKYIDKSLILWRTHNSTTNRTRFEKILINLYKFTFAWIYREYRTLKRATLLKERGL